MASAKATNYATNVAIQRLKCTHKARYPSLRYQDQADTPSSSTKTPSRATTLPSHPCSDDGPNLLVNSSWYSTDAKILLVPSFQSCCELCWETQGCAGFAYFTHNWGRGVYKECSQTSNTTASNLNAQAPESATGYFS